MVGMIMYVGVHIFYMPFVFFGTVAAVYYLDRLQVTVIAAVATLINIWYLWCLGVQWDSGDAFTALLPAFCRTLGAAVVSGLLLRHIVASIKRLTRPGNRDITEFEPGPMFP
jgi:hypothetical protein